MSRRLLTAAVVCLGLLLPAGCVRMPDSGPVVQTGSGGSLAQERPFDIEPKPPRPGDSPAAVVKGFLDAMTASPIDATVARQFLTGDAAAAWTPELETITYADASNPRGSDPRVSVTLSGADRLDSRGTWLGPLPRDQRVLQFPVARDDNGEWRLTEVPNALIVPETWFELRFRQVSLYFFDPTAEVLVPEPVFVPRGEQFASSLVLGLLAQPTGESQDVIRTYFPAGTTQGLSVPISSGIAEVALSGDPDAIDQDTADRMLIQLVETLRQEPRINAVQLSVGGRAIGFGGNATQTGLDVGSGYDPSDLASRDLYALDRGLVVSGAIGAFEPTLGPLGQEDYGIRSIGVDLSGSRVAAVSDDGSALLVAPMEQPDGQVATVVSGAVDLAAPSWDHRDRTWVLDRGAGRARVILAVDGVASVPVVPGLSGRTVTELLVSRDGSRLVAVVRGATSDRVVSTRVRYDAAGTVIGFTAPRTLPLTAEGSPRIRDIAWRSTTTVSVLSDLGEDSSEVRTLSVDGSPGEIATGGTTRLRGLFRMLLSAPVDSEVFALAGRTVKSLTRPERTVPALPPGLTSLSYTG